MNILLAQAPVQIAVPDDDFSWWQIAMLVFLLGFLVYCTVRSWRRRE